MMLLFWLCQYELPRLIAVEGFPPRLFFCLKLAPMPHARQGRACG